MVSPTTVVGMAVSQSKSKVLFLAVEIVNSSAFKVARNNPNGVAQWITAFEAFFVEAPIVFLGQLALASEESDDLVDTWVWKVMGDKLVFAAYPSGVEEALLVILAFYRTVMQLDARFLARWALRVRGCCWGASLGTYNRRVLIPDMQPRVSGQTFDDFLGQDVDIGFRLAKCVGAGQVIASANLVESLIKLSHYQGLRFHLIGRQVLPGIYGGRPYPLILISIADALPELWEWEPTPDHGLACLRDLQPTAPDFLAQQLTHIREHLYRMHGIDIGAALFSDLSGNITSS